MSEYDELDRTINFYDPDSYVDGCHCDHSANDTCEICRIHNTLTEAKRILLARDVEINRLRADASYQCAAQWRDKYHAAEAGCKRLRDLLSEAHACVCLFDCPDDYGGDDVRHGELCVRIREELEK